MGPFYLEIKITEGHIQWTRLLMQNKHVVFNQKKSWKRGEVLLLIFCLIVSRHRHFISRSYSLLTVWSYGSYGMNPWLITPLKWQKNLWQELSHMMELNDLNETSSAAPLIIIRLLCTSSVIDVIGSRGYFISKLLFCKW